MPIYSNRPRGPAGGDLSGSYPDPQVVNLSGSATGSFSGSFAGDGSGLVNLSTPTISASHVLYVSADSTDTGADGSFNKPFKTISASLTYAKIAYPSAEHVEIFLNPGNYSSFTIDRHNTYIKSDLSHERQRGAVVSGPIVINCSGSTQKYNQIVGFDGLFITGPSNSVDPTVYLSGSGAHLTYFKDCFVCSNTNNSHIFKCDADFDTHKMVFRDSTFLAEKSGSAFLQLNGGDIEFNAARILCNTIGSGVCVSGSGDIYIAADRLFVETYTNGNIFEIASSRTLPLVIANSSLSTYGAGKPINAPLNAVFVGNNFFGGVIANNFNINALATTYSNLSSITASNPVTVSASFPLPMWETHGNIIANSVTGSLKGDGSQVTNITASNISNFTSDVRAQFTAGPNILINNGAITASLSSSFNYIDFNTSLPSDPTFQTGRLHYGSASNSHDLEYDTDVADVTLRLGQQLVLRVRNNTASQINKGKLVKVSGSNGSSDVLYIHTASWENDAGSANTIGMVMQNIGAGADGYILLEGMITGINTDTFNAGDMIYLSSSGDYTNVKPGVPYHEVRLGHIARVQQNNGSAFIRIQNGYELDELHDVYVPNPSHGDLLVKSGSNNGSQWVNTKQLSGSYSITGSLSIVGDLKTTSLAKKSAAPDTVIASYSTASHSAIKGFINTRDDVSSATHAAEFILTHSGSTPQVLKFNDVYSAAANFNLSASMLGDTVSVIIQTAGYNSWATMYYDTSITYLINLD